MVAGIAYSIYYNDNLSSGPGDVTFINLAVAAAPFALIFSVIDVYLGIKYLYKVSLDKWKFYGIQVR